MAGCRLSGGSGEEAPQKSQQKNHSAEMAQGTDDDRSPVAS
jgi:hypothetical protein